jgi:hypothetical protein
MKPELFPQLIIMAVLLESLVETVKPLWKPAEISVTFYVTLGASMLVATGINYLAGLDVFSAAGIPLVKAPWVGVIATGVLLSRGANFAHDLIKVVLSFKPADK